MAAKKISSANKFGRRYITKVWEIIFELFFGTLLLVAIAVLIWLWDVFDFSSLIEGASNGTGAQTAVTFSNLSEFIRAAFIGVGVIGGGYGLILAAKRTEKVRNSGGK